MSRRPEPWYREDRGSWFVQVKGKQVCLGKSARKTAKPPAAVMQEYHRIMLGSALATPVERARARWSAWHQNRMPESLRGQRGRERLASRPR